MNQKSPFSHKIVPRYKVLRTCPRCKTRAYHFGNDMGIHHQIRCANCAHVWKGRLKKEEEQ